MRKNMKKIMMVVTAVAMMVGTMAGCSSKNDKKDGTVTIGIGQFAEHGSLDNCREGFLEGLREEGYVEGENLTVLYDNAQTDGGIATQIATNFISKKVDLICGIATPMAQSAYGTAKSEGIPVIFTAVSDPITAKLAKEDGTPVGEVTGTSDKLPVSLQLEMIREVLPDAKKIGIMYSTSEVNSISALEVYKEEADKYGFEIVESGISTTADIPLAADTLLEKVDCITNLTDNTVVSSLPIILEKANAKNIPVFGSEVEQVKIGCVVAVGLDYYQLGVETGKMAAQVLKGEKKASEINYETFSQAAIYVNTAAADKVGLTISDEVLATAKETFTEIATQE